MMRFALRVAVGSFRIQAKSEMAPGIALLQGETGAGKTTLLRMLAGLQRCDGFMEVDGCRWVDSKKGIWLAACARSVGFAWADSVVLPWKSSWDNLVLGASTKERDWVEYLMDAFAVVQRRRATELSRGEIQRLMLARAFVRRPRLVLLDEPFGAQPETMRRRLRAALRDVQQQTKAIVVFASHDSDDRSIADACWHMRKGSMFSLTERRWCWG